MQYLPHIAVGVIAYLLGSISVGLLVSRMMGGPNLREVGSGNTGATNALRAMGIKGGIIVFVGDIIKALIACIIGRVWLDLHGAMIAGLMVVIGHNWPIFFQFKGGKGVSCTLSAMLMSFPIPAVICYLVAIVVIALTKYVSLGSILLAAIFAILVAILHTDVINIVWAVAIAGLLIIRHHANIRRLIKGEERKLGSKKK